MIGPDQYKFRELRKQAARISLAVGVGMFVVKSSAYFLTQSAAILSDALESIVHVAATAMAYYSIIVSARPADESHPYGHGKVEFFSAGIEGGLIIVAALAIIYEAIRGLIYGTQLQQLEVGTLLILVASVVNLILGLYLIRRGTSTSSLTLVAGGKHVLADAYTSFGVVAGLALVQLTGFQLIDSLVALAVAANIIISGYKLVRVSVGGLMDESDTQTLQRLATIIDSRRTPEWITVHQLRIMRSGRMHHVDFHLTVPFYWNVQKTHKFQHSITDTINEGLNYDAHTLIHLDPCVPPRCCVLCNVAPCRERKKPFEKDPDWSVTSLVGSPPY